MLQSRGRHASARAEVATALPRLHPARPPRPHAKGRPTAAQTDARPRHMPALDGLRAIAVLAVIAYHVHAPWAPGGLLGVGVFFVLSGYLITDLLVAEWERAGRIDFRAFWLRRARRLLPALWVMLVVVTAYVTLFDRSTLGALRGDLLAALLYVSNWWLIVHHVSYFASFGPPSPLGHLWSLAVEEQFYLLWPPLLALGLGRMPRRRALLALLTLALAAASALAMAALYQPGTDPSRVYDGTDTRAFALLIGAALALVWPSRNLIQGALQGARRRLVDLAGLVALLALLAMVVGTNEYQTFLYPDGLVLLSFAAAVLVAVLAHPDSRLGRALAWAPLRWLGVRSYAIYLWHYPVIVLTTPLADGATFGPLRALLQIGASILLADLSWRLVEAPVRRGALGRLIASVRAGWSREVWRRLGGAERGGTAAAAGILVIAFAGVVGLGPVAIGVGGHGGSGARASETVRTAARVVARASAPTVVSSGPVPAPAGGSVTGALVRPPATPNTLPACHGLTAIGDSIMVDARPDIEAMVPGAYVSAVVGRQLYQAAAAIPTMRADGHLANCVIIELGTNGPFTRAQLVDLLRSLGRPKRIVLVNTRVPRPWQAVVNQTLADVAATWPHTVLVNWYALSQGKAAWFWPDGVHLDPVGAKVYARLLVDAVEAPRA